MILSNPTDEKVTIIINGKEFSVNPRGTTEDLSKDVAERWLNTHEFLRVVSDKILKEVKKELEEAEVTVPVSEEAPTTRGKAKK